MNVFGLPIDSADIVRRISGWLQAGLPSLSGQKKEGNPFGSPNRNCEKLQYISPFRPRKSSPIFLVPAFLSFLLLAATGAKGAPTTNFDARVVVAPPSPWVKSLPFPRLSPDAAIDA